MSCSLLWAEYLTGREGESGEEIRFGRAECIVGEVCGRVAAAGPGLGPASVMIYSEDSLSGSGLVANRSRPAIFIFTVPELSTVACRGHKTLNCKKIIT